MSNGAIQVLKDVVRTVLEDNRHYYEDATVQVNAPLALHQSSRKSRLATAKKALLAHSKQGEHVLENQVVVEFEHPEKGKSIAAFTDGEMTIKSMEDEDGDLGA